MDVLIQFCLLYPAVSGHDHCFQWQEWWPVFIEWVGELVELIWFIFHDFSTFRNHFAAFCYYYCFISIHQYHPTRARDGQSTSWSNTWESSEKNTQIIQAQQWNWNLWLVLNVTSPFFQSSGHAMTSILTPFLTEVQIIQFGEMITCWKCRQPFTNTEINNQFQLLQNFSHQQCFFVQKNR